MFTIPKYSYRSMVFTNLGSSQLSLGLDFWKKDLLDIDIFQVNSDEAKNFFCGEKGEVLKLTEIINLIRKINRVLLLHWINLVPPEFTKKKGCCLHRVAGIRC